MSETTNPNVDNPQEDVPDTDVETDNPQQDVPDTDVETEEAPEPNGAQPEDKDESPSTPQQVVPGGITPLEESLARETQDGPGDVSDLPESDFDSFAGDDVEVEAESDYDETDNE